jgi:dTDP-4-dehydrorhamnose 3,5-epimerase-like enzyme
LSEQATMLYLTTSDHSPEHDSGVLWSSAGIPWAQESPILSERDASFPSLIDFRMLTSR